jgi:hypothetical protein
MAEPLRTYRFHPLERRGLFLGLGAAQLATVAVGFVAALVSLRSRIGFPGAAGAAGAALVAACLPVGGRTPVEWAPVVASWLTGRRDPSRLAAAGVSAAPRGVRLLAAPAVPGEPAVGVVRDRRTGAWSMVLPVTGRPFTLLDAEDKRRQLSAWGAVLASTARPGSPIHRVQWVERNLPVDVGDLTAYLEEAAPAANLESPAGRGYAELLATAAHGAAAHEVLLVVSIHPRRAARQLRTFGSGKGAVCALLRREMRLLAGQLRRAELDPGPPLALAALAGAVRASCEPPPSARGRRPRRGDDAAAWPVAWRDGWAEARVDGRWCATYWVAEWPRREVGPDFLVPLLLAPVARTVSLTMAPVAARAAVREVESARTAELADEELRRRAGFLLTARHRRRAEGVAQREAELADGHGELRFSGYVTVSGATPEELETAAASVEASAQQCGLELRRLFGQQVEAFAWTLPLGRGLV